MNKYIFKLIWWVFVTGLALIIFSPICFLVVGLERLANWSNHMLDAATSWKHKIAPMPLTPKQESRIKESYDEDL